MMRPAGMRTARGGFALLMVLFVLLALMVLAAPFLMTARTAERAGARARDRAAARLTLDAAGRHTRAVLEASHPALDATPWADSLEELEVSPAFPEGFLDAADPRGSMWDVESEDLAGRIDLSSASPLVIANLLDLVTLTSRPVGSEDEEIRTAGLAGLAPEGGWVWLGGELIAYGSSEQGRLADLARGQRTSTDEDDNLVSSGPHPARDHDAGEPIVDERAYALAIRRSHGVGAPLPLDSYEQLEELDGFCSGPGLTPAQRAVLEEATTPHGGLRGGAVWQRPARIMNNLEPDPRGIQFVILDNRRWFTTGTTVLVTDGLQSELRVVVDHGQGGVVFDRKLSGSYTAYRALAYPLSRRPVNVNTASPLVLKALVQNLGLRGRNRRIDAREAEALAALIVESRPFAHMQDFLERVVLPAGGIAAVPDDAPVRPAVLAAGEALIDVHDAEALYRNALNANDLRLQFSTMPFCFSSRDVYTHELRATVNAPTGVERAFAVRRRTELVAPQGELFALWARQEDFDELLRLPRGGAWWATGPEPTTRYDAETVPPSRFGPHWGSLGNAAFNAEAWLQLQAEVVAQQLDVEVPVPRRVFADRGEDGYAQLWPARMPATSQFMTVEHFDFETRDVEGRYLPDQTIRRTTADQGLVDDAGLLQPLHVSMWVRERDRTENGLLLDIAGNTPEADRISLTLEADDLVLRVFDGFGDHPGTPGFDEITQVRYALAQGDGPGLPVDVWHHVSVDVTGSRPDQVTMLVNGSGQGVRTLAMSSLAAPLSPGSTQIVLENGEGFPERGVVRIGNELIEYRGGGGDVLDGSFDPAEGFGGRLARERLNADGQPPDGGLALSAVTPGRENTGLAAYPSGTPVSLYGYSLPVQSSVLTGGGELPAGGDLGAFAVARVAGLTEGETRGGFPVVTQEAGVVWGYGLTDQPQAGLVLVSADTNEPDEATMAAFHPAGGYALVLQLVYQFPGLSNNSNLTIEGLPVGGMEVVRYSGFNGNVLQVDARGDAIQLQYPGQPLGDRHLGPTKHAFIVDWEDNVTTGAGRLVIDGDMRSQTFVLPISLPVGGAGGGLGGGFQTPLQGSAFAQITRLDDPSLTEWVRYDEVDSALGQLVRSNQQALFDAYLAVVLEERGLGIDQLEEDDDDETGGAPPPDFFLASPRVGPPPSFHLAMAPAQDAQTGTFWSPVLGQSEIDQRALTLAVSNRFQFRGVLETFSHVHPAGTVVLPVFTVADPGLFGMDLGLDWGRPGRGDRVFLAEPDATDIGLPATIHRAHAPRLNGRDPVRPLSGWQPIVDERYVAGPVGEVSWERDGGYRADGLIYYALEEPAPNFLLGADEGAGAVGDSRLAPRLVKFPSGELPRLAATMAVGTSATGDAASAGAQVPSALVDELRTARHAFGAGGIAGSAGGSLVLASVMGADDLSLQVMGGTLRTSAGLTQYLAEYNQTGPRTSLVPAAPGSGAVDGLRPGGGLLRIGEEIVAYETFSGDTIGLALNGRGLLGSGAQPHMPGEPIQFLEGWRATTLAAAMDTADEDLAVVSADGLGFSGTVLVDQELMHFTRNDGQLLGMPTRSEEPGAMDNEGPGIFRARFGTQPAGHVAGTPVVLFPFRYWDRWSDRADEPELAWFGFEHDQPGAFWLSTFFETEDPAIGGSRIEVLVRTDPRVPWDADPDLAPGLVRLETGTRDGLPIELGLSSDRIEWRAYVRYDQGAFDPINGQSHGWKATPRLRHLGGTYLAPRRVLESVDR